MRRPPTLILLAILAALAPLRTYAQAAWTTAPVGLPGVLFIFDAAYGNGRFVATTGGSVSAMWSTDGATWQAATAAQEMGSAVRFVGGAFHAIGNGGIWRSATGETWEHVTGGVAPGEAVAASDGRGILTLGSGPGLALLYSPDMVTFLPGSLPVSVPAGSIAVIMDIGYGAGHYFVSYFSAPSPGSKAEGGIFATVDGTIWTRVASGLTGRRRMAGSANSFIAFVDHNRVMYSGDGTTFTTHSAPFALANGDSLVHVGGRFFMARSLLSSLDGLNWSPLATGSLPSNADMRAMAYGGGRYLTVGAVSSVPPSPIVALLAAPAPPIFATQPVSVAVAEHQRATFSATLENPTVSTTFQWRRDGVIIPGATGPTFTISAVQFSDSGRYTVEARNPLGPSTSAPATLTIVPVGLDGRLINVSVLTSLDAPGTDFTMGFVVGGGATTDLKPLLIRAGGPSLTQFGVTEFNPDPRLELFAGNTSLGSNDAWGGTPALVQAAAQVGAYGFVSAASADAALFEPAVAPGDKSVKISAGGGATGRVLAEVYDATPSSAITASTPRLINVSVLKGVAPGQTLDAGFVIGGLTPKTLLIRAVGPGLAPFNVGGVLPDPRLALFRGGATAPVVTNARWGGTAELRAAFAGVGAFDLPAGSADAALLLSLSPGSYVAQVAGSAGTGGLVLVEVYEVP
jgi:hypothetical protein